MTRIFVYGTLLRDEGNHFLLATSTFVADARTRAEYRMVVFESARFPAVTRQGGRTSIVGEVYDVDAPTLARLDQLEGHPRFYRRTPIVLASGMRAEVYLLPDAGHRPEDIRSGSWRAHLAATKRGRP